MTGPRSLLAASRLELGSAGSGPVKGEERAGIYRGRLARHYRAGISLGTLGSMKTERNKGMVRGRDCRLTSSPANPLGRIARVCLLVGWMAGCLSLVGCWESTAKTATDDDLPSHELSKPIPYPGNHAEIALTVDPNQRRQETAASEADKQSQKSRTMFDPENLRVKPGHWITVQNEGLARDEDFSGYLEYSMRRGDFVPRVIPGTRYYLRSRRPAALAKDQPKRFETPMFVVDAIPLTIAPELKSSSGSLVEQVPERLLPLKRHQYHCVVMTDTADTYRYLTVMPSIRNLRLNKWLSDTSSVFGDDEAMIDYSQSSLDTFQIDSLYYKVTYSDWDGGVELPSNPQQWSSIAYLLWADFAPERMSQEQQTALLDWLHFGGQLIVGVDAMADLNQSFLKDYLPATPTGSVNEPLTAQPNL